MRAITISDWGALAIVTTTATIGRQRGPERVDPQPPPPARRPLPPPVPDHPGLADREVDEHADGVERDQEVRLALEQHDQGGGDRGQDDDPVAEREAVAAERELAGHEAIDGQDREQPRERVEAGVRGQDEEERRESLEQEERDRAGAVDLARDLADHRLLLGLVDVGDPEVDRQERQADEQHPEQAGHDRQGRRRVLRLRRLERRDAGRDRLGPGQGHGPGRERAQEQDQRQVLEASLRPAPGDRRRTGRGR